MGRTTDRCGGLEECPDLRRRDAPDPGSIVDWPDRRGAFPLSQRKIAASPAELVRSIDLATRSQSERRLLCATSDGREERRSRFQDDPVRFQIDERAHRLW